MEARPATVYVVEDNAPLRARIIEMLHEACRPRIVGEAETAVDAIAGIRATHPDAVVLDLNLRKSSGLDVLRAFQRDDTAPLFIVLTNDPCEPRRRDCLAAGAGYFLDKSHEFLRINDIVGSLAPGAHA
jgi:DNA-binding NarL/FixJ family response regulator